MSFVTGEWIKWEVCTSSDVLSHLLGRHPPWTLLMESFSAKLFGRIKLHNQSSFLNERSLQFTHAGFLLGHILAHFSVELVHLTMRSFQCLGNKADVIQGAQRLVGPWEHKSQIMSNQMHIHENYWKFMNISSSTCCRNLLTSRACQSTLVLKIGQKSPRISRPFAKCE